MPCCGVRTLSAHVWSVPPPLRWHPEGTEAGPSHFGSGPAPPLWIRACPPHSCSQQVTLEESLRCALAGFKGHSSVTPFPQRERPRRTESPSISSIILFTEALTSDNDPHPPSLCYLSDFTHCPRLSHGHFCNCVYIYIETCAHIYRCVCIL